MGTGYTGSGTGIEVSKGREVGGGKRSIDKRMGWAYLKYDCSNDVRQMYKKGRRSRHHQVIIQNRFIIVLSAFSFYQKGS